MSAVTFNWHTDVAVPVICTLDYQPFCGGSSEYRGGPPMEPDEPESMTLETATVNGIDIASLLSEAQVERIESLALEQRTGDAQ